MRGGGGGGSEGGFLAVLPGKVKFEEYLCVLYNETIDQGIVLTSASIINTKIIYLQPSSSSVVTSTTIETTTSSSPPTPTIRFKFHHQLQVSYRQSVLLILDDTEPDRYIEFQDCARFDVHTIISNRQIPICAQWNETGITVGGHSNGSFSLNQPLGLFIDSTTNNTLYVADFLNNRILGYSSLSDVVTTVYNETFSFPTTVYVDSKQNIYIDASGTNQILKISSTNSSLTVVVSSGTFINSYGFIIDEQKQLLYVSDDSGHRILRWNLNTTTCNVITVITGVRNQSGSDELHLNYPRGLDIAGDEEEVYLYVADFGNHRIQRYFIGNSSCDNITRAGITVAGNGTLGSGLNQLNGPRNLYVTKNNEVFIADTFNHRIMRWSLNSTTASGGGVCVLGCASVAGNGTTELNQPSDIKFDSNGNLYVCDTGNNRIQKFNILIDDSCE
ncbi:unnamed protein product [Didymodactylos carnosus]|uniref:NHL repeat-containing protein n=1 Tax=Didymodactylos carnosus TaxID=1234261 RepID=A0A8S2DMC9_9BILA|nr:unnamed protein product [Didymodactylos carnosus]CAF3708170.1 unnamed protein product [Didymodactylos carnosus]